METELRQTHWSCSGDDSPGDVVIRLSTSVIVQAPATRAAVPQSLCEVELQLHRPGVDVFHSAAELEAVAATFRSILDEITWRFPNTRRVHLFAAVQAGLALLLGTQVSRNNHPPIVTYQFDFKAGAFHPAPPINALNERPKEPKGEVMTTEFQPLFDKFHNNIRLTDENDLLRQRRDAILDHLREHMKMRRGLKFRMFNSGSYAMGTGIQPLAGSDYDLDAGIIFSLEHAQQDARELKAWVHGGLPSSLGNVVWRRPCITVFRKGHHLDLGVYVEDAGGLWLAMGRAQDPKVEWQQDGIQLFIEDVRNKFPDTKADHQQFQRVIRYLKRWKDLSFQGNGVKAPVGLALTVMAYRWFSPRRSAGNYNDLGALTDLVQSIIKYFDNAQVGLNFPRAPKDNLLRKLSAEQVNQMHGRFQKLAKLLEDAAVRGSTEPLRRAFGADFPES